MLLQQLRRALAALLKSPCDAETDGEQLPFVLQLAQVFAAHSQTLAVELLLQQHPHQLQPQWRSILSAFPEAIPPQRFLHLLPRQIPTFDSNGYGSARNSSSSSVLEATAEDIAAWTVERCLAVMKGPGLLQHCALPLATAVLLMLLRQAPPADLAAAAAAALQQQQQAREALTMSRLDQKQLQQIQQQHELLLRQQKQQQQRAAAAAAEASLSAAVLAAGHTPLTSTQAASAQQANSHSPPAAAEDAAASATSTMPDAAEQVEVMGAPWGIDKNLLLQQQHAHSELQNGYPGIRRLCALHGLLRQFLLLQMLQLRCRELQQQQEHPVAASPPTVFRRPPPAGKRLQQELQQKRVLLESATEDFFSFVRLTDSSRLLLLLLHLVAAQQQQELGSGTCATETEGNNSRTQAFAAAAVATLVEPFATLECFASPEGQTPDAAVAAGASDAFPAAAPVPITAAQPHEDLTPLLRAVDSCFRRGLLLELSLCLSAEAADPLTAAAALRASRCSAAAAVGAAAGAAEGETGPARSTEEGLAAAATGLTEATALRLLRWVLLLLAAKCSSPQLPPECRLIPDASLLLRLALVAAYRKDSCLPGARVAVYVKAVLREALQQRKQQQQQQLGTAWAPAFPAAAASAAAEAVAAAAGVPSPPEKELQSDVSLLLHQTEAVVAAQELLPGRGKGPVLRATFLDLRAAALSEKAAKQLLLPLLEEAIWQQQAACSTGSSRSGEKAGAEWMNMFNRTVYIHRKLSVAMPPTDFYMHLASLLASLPPLQTADVQQQQQHPLLLLLPLWEQAALLAGDNTRKDFAESCCCLLLQRAQSLLDKPPQQVGPHTALAATLLQRAAAVAEDALHALQQHLQQLPPQTQQQQQQRQLQRIKTDIEQEMTLHSVVVLLYDLLQQQQQQQWALPSALGAASAAAATAAAAAAAAAEAAISRARGAALNALLSSGDTDSEGRGSSDSEGPSNQQAAAATATTAGGTATDAALKVAAARATAAEAACVLLQLAQPPVLRQQLRTAFGRRQLLSVLLQKQPQLALQQQQMMKHLGKLLSIEADEQQQLIDIARGFAYRALGERGAATTIAATLLAAELHKTIAETAAGVGPAKEDGKRRESLDEADQTTHKRQRTAASTQGEQVEPAAAKTMQQYAAAAAAAACRLARSTERPLLASLGEAAAADLLHQQAPRLASRVVAAAVCNAADEQLPGLLRCAAAARSAAAASPAGGVSQPQGRPAGWEPATAADLVPPPDASTPGEADNQSLALKPSQASAVWLLNSQNFRPQGSNSNGSGTVQYQMARSVLKLLGSEKPTAAAAVAAAGNIWGPPSFLFVSAFEAAGGAVASAAASAKQFYAAALAADAAADAHIQQQQEQQRHQQHPANTGGAAAEAASARAVASALHEWGVLKEVGESSSRSALIAAAFSPLLGAPKDLLLQPSSWELAGVPAGVVDWQALLRRDVAVAVLLLSSAGVPAPGATAAPFRAPATPPAAANAASSEECISEELLLTSSLPASCAALLQTPGLTATELLLVVHHLLLLELMPLLLLLCPQNPSLERLATALLLLLRFLKRVPHPRHLRISNSGGQDSSKRELPVLLGARLVGDSAYRRDTLLQIGAADSSLIDAAAAAMAAAEPLSAPLKSLQPLVPKKGLSFCSSSSTTVSPLSGTVGAHTGPPQQLQQHRQQQQVQQQQHPAMETDEDASSATPCHLTPDNSVVKSCALVKDPSCLASAESTAETPNQDPQQHQRQELHRQMQEPPKAVGFQPNAEVSLDGTESNDATVIESLGGEGLSLRLEHAKKTLLLNATPLNIAMASEASPSVSVLLRCAPAALGLLVLDCMAALLQANKPQTLSLLHPSVLRQLCHREARREQHSPAAETADSAATETTGGGSAAAAVAAAAASVQYSSFDSVGDCVLHPQEFQRRILFMRRLFACCVSALRCEPALFLLPTVRRAAAEATAVEADRAPATTESSLLRVARVAVESAGLGALADEETLGALQLSMSSLDAAALLLPPPCLLQDGSALSGPADAIQSATPAHVDDPFAASFAAAADSSNICVALCLRQQMKCLARRSSAAALCFSALEKHLQQLKKNFSGLSFPAFDVLENYELRQTAADQCSKRTAGDAAVSQRTPDAACSVDTSGAASDIVSLLLKQLPLEDWGRLLMHVKPLGPSLQLLIALPMHHQLQQHHQGGPLRDEDQRMHSDADDLSGHADRAELTNKLRQLLDRLVTILPFAASWEQRVGSSPSFFTEDRTVPEAAAELLTTATDEVYKAFSGTFWRLACRHALAHPRHSTEAEAACPRVAVLSDLAALISTGFSAWLRSRWQLMHHQEQQQHLQQEEHEQFQQSGLHELHDVRSVADATPELVETALDKLLQRTAYVPLKSTCESLAFALFVLQQITRDSAPYKTTACDSSVWESAELLTHIRLFQVLVGHTRSLRNTLEVLDAEQQASMDSLAANCFKTTSELLQIQERCLDRLAVYALFPDKKDRKVCSTLLNVRTADSGDCKEPDVGNFVLRVIETLNVQGNAFTTSRASVRSRCAALLLWRGERSCGNQCFGANASAMRWSPLWSDSVLQLPQEIRQDSAPPETGVQRTTESKAWNALLDTAESIEDVMILRLLSGKHVADNAHLYWEGQQSPLLMLMTWDAQLHVSAVKRLLEKSQISGASNRRSHSGCVSLPGLHSQLDVTNSSVDMLQLAHAFAAACLLLLTGQACALTNTTFFPFVMELLEEDLWWDDTSRDTHTATATTQDHNASKAAGYWIQSIQRFLLKWWIRGSGELEASQKQKRGIRDICAENEVSMFQVVEYLSTFVRSLRSVLQRSLVLQLCLRGNLNTAVCAIRKFGNTILPPRGVHKLVEISQYLSLVYPSPICFPQESKNDRYHGCPNGNFFHDISVGSMELSVAFGQSSCKKCRPSCDMYLEFVPGQYRASVQRYLAQRFNSTRMPKAYVKDLECFLLRASTAIRQQLSMAL